MTREQAIQELLTAVEGWLWFDNEFDAPADRYSEMVAYESAKCTITERVALAAQRLRDMPREPVA